MWKGAELRTLSGASSTRPPPSVRVSMASLRRGGWLTHCPLVVSYPPELAWTKGCHLLTSWLVFLVTRPPRRLSRDPPRVVTFEQRHCCPPGNYKELRSSVPGRVKPKSALPVRSQCVSFIPCKLCFDTRFFCKFEPERERETERDERAGEGRKGPVAPRLQGRPCAPGPAVSVVSGLLTCMGHCWLPSDSLCRWRASALVQTPPVASG